MTELRHSTVFDYSNLRLHPDGTRVNQKSTNLAPRIATTTVRTFSRNWIARDAGGPPTVREFTRTKRTLQDSQGDEEYISLGTGTEIPNPEDGRKGRKFKELDARTAKRRKFLEDYDYLNERIPSSTNLASDTGTKSFPYEPSSVRPSFSTFALDFLV